MSSPKSLPGTLIDSLVESITRAREEARVHVDMAAAAAEDLAATDVELQRATDSVERMRLANDLRHAAAMSDRAEGAATRSVFHLRLAERSLERAHALMLSGRAEDVHRAKMLGEVAG